MTLYGWPTTYTFTASLSQGQAMIKRKYPGRSLFLAVLLLVKKILAFLCFLKSHTDLFYLNIQIFFYFNKDPISVDKT